MERERERFEEVERDFAYKLQTELKERERERFWKGEFRKYLCL